MPAADPSPPSPVLAVIPARFASTRFPGKPLANRTGKYLIQHVVERVRLARTVGRIIVATDDPRICDAVRSFGGEAAMTRPDHPNGTSRIAEVVAARFPMPDAPASGQQPLAWKSGGGEADLQHRGHGGHRGHGEDGERRSIDSGDFSVPSVSSVPSVFNSSGAADIILNVQGDEPDIEPHVIDALVAGLRADRQAPMATLASDFAPDEDPANPNIVKIVTTAPGVSGSPLRALYFSRSLIPFDRDRRGVRPLKHPGLYAYRRVFLLRYVTLPPTPLELAEQLEQLRALEHGYAIAVVKVAARHHGIDTPQQYDEFVRRWQAAKAGATP